MTKEVAEMARYLSQRFETSNSEEEKEKTPYQVKKERYEMYAEKGHVLIREGAMDGTWMPLDDAHSSNLVYIDPNDWLFRQY